MKFREFYNIFNKQPYITSEMIAYKVDNLPYIQRQISERVQKKLLVQIKKGLYIFPDVYRQHTLSQFNLASAMTTPSYISTESALSFWGMIPEGVFSTTSITTKNTKHYTTPVGNFSFRHIKTLCFTGYSLQDNYYIATPTKALVDFLYYQLPSLDAHDKVIEKYRLQALEQLDTGKLMDYCQLFANKKLTTIILSLIDHDDGYLTL